MESVGLKLSDEEQLYYGQLFATLDANNSGKVTAEKALDLLNKSNLALNVIEQIIELCGANRLGQFGRSQFYVALKLVAIAQHKSAKEISPSLSQSDYNTVCQLPTFFAHERKKEDATNEVIHRTASIDTACRLPSTRNKAKYDRNRSNSLQKLAVTNDNLMHINGNKVQAESQFKWDRNSSLENMNQLTGSNTFPHSDKSWSEFESKNGEEIKRWDEFEEGHHLLGNEEMSDNSECDEEEDSEKEEEEKEKEKEEEEDLWVISKEQREYYLNQYKILERDTNGRIRGNVAREFFEKSNLPVDELSHIWHLSDVDQDGALNLGEFCTAMHLVILRRNHIELPTKLPISLLPYTNKPNKPITPITCHSANNDPSIVLDEKSTTSAQPSLLSLSAPLSTPSAEPTSIQPNTLSPKSKDWVKCESPISITSSSTLQPHPANFNFNVASITKDPNIVHPVEMRVSPDGQIIPYKVNETFHNLNGATTNSYYKSSLSPIPQASPIVIINGKKEPPPPPPRPSRTVGHARSSSLDLKKLNVCSDNFANFDNFHCKPHASSNGPILPNGKPLYSREDSAFIAYKRSDISNSKSPSQTERQIVLMESIKSKFKLPKEVSLQDVKLSDVNELMKVVRLHQERDREVHLVHDQLMLEFYNVMEGKLSLEAMIEQMKLNK